jgi:hypothetical protein
MKSGCTGKMLWPILMKLLPGQRRIRLKTLTLRNWKPGQKDEPGKPYYPRKAQVAKSFTVFELAADFEE